MRTLNDPIDYEPNKGDRWTPLIGLRRGFVHGVAAAGVLALLMTPVALYLPFMLIVAWLRIPLAFGLTWVLASVVQRAAGMAGGACSAVTLAVGGIALMSNHIVFALFGVPDVGMVDPWWTTPMTLVNEVVPAQEGMVIGWRWLHPYTLAIVNVVPLGLGGGFATAFRNSG